MCIVLSYKSDHIVLIGLLILTFLSFLKRFTAFQLQCYRYRFDSKRKIRKLKLEIKKHD